MSCDAITFNVIIIIKSIQSKTNLLFLFLFNVDSWFQQIIILTVLFSHGVEMKGWLL